MRISVKDFDKEFFLEKRSWSRSPFLGDQCQLSRLMSPTEKAEDLHAIRSSSKTRGGGMQNGPGQNPALISISAVVHVGQHHGQMCHEI